jgi:dipeptidyl aminopeptidase/acylaminoacyl peptidase
VATPSPAGPPGSGRIAIVRRDGSLAIVDDRGGPILELAPDGAPFGPPAWSADGTSLAAIGAGTVGRAIHVFAIPAKPGAAPDDRPGSRLVYDSAERAPFYLSWSPDGERVAFLAVQGELITLRTAPADGGEPLDGPAGDGILRIGAPLYFAWHGPRRLLLHVGSGDDAFTGVVDTDGRERDAGLAGTGDFRAAVERTDGEALAFVRGVPPAAALVVAEGDGDVLAELAVHGPAAMAFQPGGDLLAVVAADETLAEPFPFPFGPLRLVGPDGEVTTLVEDPVVGFYWSPDGSTIAALRVLDAPGSTEAARGDVVPAVAEPEPATEIHLTFVEVVGGRVRSDRVVRLGSGYFSMILPYFDQYAMSHQVWAPDGSAVVLPLAAGEATPVVTVLGVDGDDRPIGEGIHATWAP